MSILIKGMEMPKSCGECPCLDQQNGICQANADKEYVYSNKPSWCPLVELPHGDLIDRDEMREIAIALLDEAVTDQEANAIRGMWSRLGKMPVYIPTEEEET